MTNLGFQLYSLHDIPDDLPYVLERVGDTAFDGVEFAGLGDARSGEVAATLERTSLRCAGAHVGLDELETDPSGVAASYVDLGCHDLVVPWLPPSTFETPDAVETAADRLTAVADVLADEGVSLHYHNHDQEFVDCDGELGLARLLDAAPDVSLELDLGWAGAAGHDPLALLKRYADRCRLVHLKDYDAATGEPTVVGDGDLDLPAVVSAVEDHDVEWVIYEAEGRPGSYETLAHAADVVEEYWG